MKLLYLKFIKLYLNLVSVIAPKYGGKVAFKLFQRVTLKTFKKKELDFYNKIKPFKVKQKNEDLHCYETGNPDGNLVFLVHGWNSNAGSMSKIAMELVDNNYKVISFDLPGHGKTIEKHTNLYTCKEAFKELIASVNPQKPFYVISHSFGSIVSAYALSETIYETEKLVVLSSVNKLEDVFLYFKNQIGFNDVIYSKFKMLIEELIGEEFSKMIVADKINEINLDTLLLIHDKFDKVVPFENAEIIHENVENSRLMSFEKIGHYRMLWNDYVVEETMDFIKN